MNGEPVSEREALILKELIATYFATGAPVGSRVLAEIHPGSPSPATVRNVLAELETRGLLTHPHTSAGRVPTSQALHWWLEQQAPPMRLAGDAAAGLERALREATDDASLWRLGSEFLSEISHQVGMVAVHAWQELALRHLRFFRLTEHRVLAILEATDGQVRERVCRVPQVYTQAELDAAARYFNHHFAGSTLARIRQDLLWRVEAEREAYHELVKRVVVLTHCGLLEMDTGSEVYFQGTRHLAAACGAEQLEGMLQRLNEKEQWLQLLTELNAGEIHERGRVQVRIGLEEEAMPGFSLIAAQHRQGAVGILGATCMEYPKALAAVALVRDLFEQVLGEDAGRN